MTKLLKGTDFYTQTLVCLYNLMFSVMIVVAEFSPLLLEEFLKEFFPFLASNYGKAVFYVILGTFLLDGKLNDLAHICGIILIVCGLAWALYEYFFVKRLQKRLENAF